MNHPGIQSAGAEAWRRRMYPGGCDVAFGGYGAEFGDVRLLKVRVFHGPNARAKAMRDVALAREAP